jgi:hypothetical protein
MTAVDWRRVAEPQEDGYDVQVALDAFTRSRYAHKTPRALPHDVPLVWKEGRASFVRLADNVAPDDVMKDLPTDDRRVQQGLLLIDTWPAVRLGCAQLLIGLAPLTMGFPDASGGGHGCCCGNFGDDFGWIYVTADSASGFAEGIVHEMAHWKLRAFEIWFEDWTQALLLNRPDELYASPVRKDMTRPMGAVLHAQYSYVHVAAICNAMLKATPDPTKDDYDWTALQLRRITEGQGTLREFARGTPDAGVPFLEGLDNWTARVLKEGWDAVAPGGFFA